jgi:hypothetical protein
VFGRLPSSWWLAPKCTTELGAAHPKGMIRAALRDRAALDPSGTLPTSGTRCRPSQGKDPSGAERSGSAGSVMDPACKRNSRAYDTSLQCEFDLWRCATFLGNDKQEVTMVMWSRMTTTT